MGEPGDVGEPRLSWIYEGREFLPEEAEGRVGFVYVITNKLNGKQYVGKKRFEFRRRKRPTKSRRRGSRYRVPSDWLIYYGSNKALVADVEKHGPQHFERVILRLCDTLGELSYYEAKEQIDREVLFGEGYYNDWVWLKVHRNHLRHS